MGEGIEIRTSIMADKTILNVEIGNSTLQSKQYFTAILEEIVRLCAQKYVESNYKEIVEKLSPEAVANLAIAHAGKDIADAVLAKPTVIENTKTEIYQKHLFGGISRVR